MPGGMALRMEGRFSWILSQLTRSLRLRLAVYEDPTELAAHCQLAGAEIIIAGYESERAGRRNTLDILDAVLSESLGETLCFAMFYDEGDSLNASLGLMEYQHLAERTLEVTPDMQKDPELPMLLLRHIYRHRNDELLRVQPDSGAFEGQLLQFPWEG